MTTTTLIFLCIFVLCVPSWFIMNKLESWVQKYPKKEREADGKMPPILGTGNGIGISMVGDFERKSGFVQYCFLMVLLPIIPLGCYTSHAVSSTSTSWKKTVTTYRTYGSQPWSIGELFCIYYRYWGRVAAIVSIIVIIAQSS